MNTFSIRAVAIAAAAMLAGTAYAWNEGGGEQDEALNLTPGPGEWHGRLRGLLRLPPS